MSKDKAREFWIAMCTFNDGYTEIYECRDAEFDPTPPSEKVHVIEYDAYAALEAKLAECVKFLEDLEGHTTAHLQFPHKDTSNLTVALIAARECLAKVKK